MKDTVFSLLLALAIEAIGAIAAYLRQRFMQHTQRSGEIWENHPEFV